LRYFHPPLDVRGPEIDLITMQTGPKLSARVRSTRYSSPRFEPADEDSGFALIFSETGSKSELKRSALIQREMNSYFAISVENPLPSTKR